MSALLTPFLWYFIPSQLTSTLLPVLSTQLPQLFPPSPPGSPVYIRNYRWTYTLLVLAYLGWSFFQADVGWGEDMYALLGVSRGVDEDELKRSFRTMSRRYHPDKNPGNEDLFIAIRQAYETLNDPVKRFAYDRLGPDVLAWKAKTVKDYMYTGLLHSTWFYVGAAGSMLLLTVAGKLSAGSYWRYTLFILLLTVELSLILSPTPPPGSLPLAPRLSRLAPTRWIDTPQFVWIRMMHRLWASTNVAISQLAGVWADRKPDEQQVFARLVELANGLENEAARQFHAEVWPVLVDSPNPLLTQEKLCQEITDVMVDTTLSSHPFVKDAWQAAAAPPQATVSRSRLPKSRQPVHGAPVDTLRDDEDTRIAAAIPLPPSPPPSPAPRLRSLR